MPEALSKDPFLSQLIGNWTITRKIRTQVETNLAEAHWVLEGQFLELTMKDVKNPPGYEAKVFIGWDGAREKYVIHWLDNFGGTGSAMGFGTQEGESIKFVFDCQDGELQNTFTRNADGTWTSLIEQTDAEGKWTVFCEDSYTPR